MQVGLVPVYVYDVYDVNDDVPWVPYKDIVPVFVHDEVMADFCVRVVTRGMERGQYTWSWCRSPCATMFLRLSYEDKFEKFGHLLNICESEPLQRLRCRVGSEGSDSPRREGAATVLSWESASIRKVCRVAGQPLGPFRLSKLGMVPVLAPFSVGMGPFGNPGDRNFDAGPSRDPYFDPLSWFEPVSFRPRNIKV